MMALYCFCLLLAECYETTNQSNFWTLVNHGSQFPLKFSNVLTYKMTVVKAMYIPAQCSL